MTQMKVLKIREFVIVATVAASMWMVIPVVLGQPTDRDWQRIERQVDGLIENRGVEALNLEKRLSSIEGNQREMNQKMDDAKRLARGALAVLIGLAIQSFWGLIVSKKKASE